LLRIYFLLVFKQKSFFLVLRDNPIKATTLVVVFVDEMMLLGFDKYIMVLSYYLLLGLQVHDKVFIEIIKNIYLFEYLVLKNLSLLGT
jgi:hypothetical protein